MRDFWKFCEWLDEAVWNLPRTAPPFLAELAYDIRHGDPITMIALCRTVMMAGILATVALLASA